MSQTSTSITPALLSTRLRETIGPDRYDRLIGDSVSFEVNESAVKVRCASRFAADMLERRFGETLRGIAKAPVRIEIDRGVALPERVGRPGESSPHAAPAAPDRARAPKRREAVPGTRHRFGDFLVGDSNKLAYAAARRIAEAEDADAFSPLFIHGACGLGKTHLLQSIAARFGEVNPGARVRCTTAEVFTNRFVQSIRAGKVREFQRQFRDCDLLCIDDVHFLANKDGTQNELLHTFDTLDLEGARVVLASDEHPRQILKLSGALVSRFVSGAVVQVDFPEPDLCLKIIGAVAQRRGLPLTPDAASALTDHALRDRKGRCTVRDFEGLLSQVEAVWRLMPELASAGHIGRAVVARALEARGSGKPRMAVDRPVRMDDVQRVVCQAMSVEREELVSTSRHKRVVLARALIVHLARELTNLSYPEIARTLGRTNHSTFITAHKRVLAQMQAGEPVAVGGRFDGLPMIELAQRLCGEARGV